MIICFTIDSFGDLLFQEKTMMRGEVNGAGEEKTTYIDATWNDGEEHINNFLTWYFCQLLSLRAAPMLIVVF